MPVLQLLLSVLVLRRWLVLMSWRFDLYDFAVYTTLGSLTATHTRFLARSNSCLCSQYCDCRLYSCHRGDNDDNNYYCDDDDDGYYYCNNNNNYYYYYYYYSCCYYYYYYYYYYYHHHHYYDDDDDDDDDDHDDDCC